MGGLTVVSLAVDEPGVRIGLVAGRRLGSSVTRNRIKRRIRHACHHVELPPRTDLVVIPSPRVAQVPFSTLVEWLQRAVVSS